MKYLRKMWAKRPLGGKRRKAAAQVKRLWQPVPLGKAERQSAGDLYEFFFSSREMDIHKWHHYFDIYERHLKQFVGTRFRFLEIGVFRGGSLRKCRDYFGADATIVGIDIDASCGELDGRYGAVRIGDQSDPEFLSSVCAEFGPFDAILDDGGHDPSQQIASFCHLISLARRKWCLHMRRYPDEFLADTPGSWAVQNICQPRRQGRQTFDRAAFLASKL